MEPVTEREAAALIGRRLGEFVIRKPLSGGGFGQVFLAEQKTLGREAVIKVLHDHHTSNPGVVQRFLREARLASLLDHPYAAHTYAFGAETDGVLWIAMELVRGTPLDTLLRVQGPIPLERFVPLLGRICEVVQTAHDQGIVHRDLKPANVMVLSRAGQLLPKLLDFGIAKLTSDDPAPPAWHDATTPAALAGVADPTACDPQLTAEGVTMGSPHYMAPEQWADSAATDARTDIYALGVICYQALTGHPPFRAQSREKVAALHARAPVPPLGPGFPPELDTVLATAMAKRKNHRHQSALELAAAFRAASGVTEVAVLPRLDPAVREAATSAAPQPLAAAVVALEAARNAHQARDAMWQIGRVAVRLVAAVALAGHSHVGSRSAGSDSALLALYGRLRQAAVGDDVWLELARELVRGFAALRDAHPVPELVALLSSEERTALDELLALRAGEDAAFGKEDEVVALLERGLPITGRVLRSLEFLFDYLLAVPQGDVDVTAPQRAAGRASGEGGGREAELWMGARGGPRPRRRVFGSALVAGQPALIDAAGAPVLVLWPFVQLHEPVPGAGPALFLFDGRGRRGARLVAMPDRFEVEDEDLLALLGDLLRDSAESDTDLELAERCPYPGLAAFGPEDAASFVGRERESEAAVNRLRVQPLFVVTGPSGAGKSSFVQAGVLPGLPAGWSPLVVRPGPAPIAALVARLASAGLDPGDLRAALAADPDALGAHLRAARGGGEGGLVLVIDQLEELFTLCEDEEERVLYAAALARAARVADDPVRVVMTLRDDFLVRAESLPGWRSRLGQGLQILTTPVPADLRRILVEPLRRVGYELDDPALPDEMIAAVAGASGALALVSFTASRLWELRDRRFRQLTAKAYRSLGGVAGALAQHAEETLTAMPAEEQRLVREVFRQTVTAEGTRAPLSPAELVEVLGSGPHASAVVEKLVAARLLVVSDGELGKWIEIAHETLLDAWPRLVVWRREDREGARLRDLVRSAARQWEERGRSSGLLWRGDELAEYRQWRARHPGPLTTGEEAFVAASLADAARGRRRRTIMIAGAFLAIAAVAVSLFIFSRRAEQQRSLADSARGDAEKSASQLHQQLMTELERQGRALVLAEDPLKGLAFLAEAARLGARGVAHDFAVAQAVRATDGELFVLPHEGLVARARFSPDGARVVTCGFDNQARLWDAGSGAPIGRLPHEAPVLRAAFSPDGRVLATGDGAGVVVLWSTDDLRERVRLRASGELQALEFAADGSLLLTGTALDEIALWDPATGKQLRTLRPASRVTASSIGSPVAFSPSGSLVAAGSVQGGPVLVWDASSGRRVASLAGHTKRVTAVRFSPDGQRLLTASWDHTAAVWRLDGQRREQLLAHRDDVNAAAFSPDGTRVATASNDRTAIVWDAASGAPLVRLAGHSAGVTHAVFGPDGKQIATTSVDGTARIWDAASGRRLARRLGHRAVIRDLTFSPDGRRMVTASLDGSAIVWSTEPDVATTALEGHASSIHAVSIARGGVHIASGGADGTVRIWDAGTGRELVTLRGHSQVVTAVKFSPDGSRVASGSADHSTRVWDPRSPDAPRVLTGPAVMAIDWTPDGKRLLGAGSEGIVRIWSLPGGERLREVHAHGGNPVNGVSVSPSGDRFATTGRDHQTCIWELASARQLACFKTDWQAYSVAYHPSGDRAVSPTSKQSAIVWRVSDGAVLTELVGHSGDVVGAEWAAGGELVVTASTDGTARIWDPDTSDLLGVFELGAVLMSASCSNDARYLVMAGNRPAALLVELPRFRGDGYELARVIRCRVPFLVDGQRVLSRPRELATCRSLP